MIQRSTSNHQGESRSSLLLSLSSHRRIVRHTAAVYQRLSPTCLGPDLFFTHLVEPEQCIHDEFTTTADTTREDFLYLPSISHLRSWRTHRNGHAASAPVILLNSSPCIRKQAVRVASMSSTSMVHLPPAARDAPVLQLRQKKPYEVVTFCSVSMSREALHVRHISSTGPRAVHL